MGKKADAAARHVEEGTDKMRMKTAAMVAAAAAMTLAGCSGGENKGPQSEAEVRSELASAERMQPGEYSSNVEIARFEVPGMPEEQQTMIRGMMTGAAQVQRSHCLTEAQAARGSEDMFREMAQGDSNCRFEDFNVDGQNITGRMICGGEGTANATMNLTGTMSGTSSTMTMVMEISDPSLPQGRAEMEMRATSRRTGDCTAESRAAAEAAERQAAEATKNAR
jgi:hypothetical protein